MRATQMACAVWYLRSPLGPVPQVFFARALHQCGSGCTLSGTPTGGLVNYDITPFSHDGLSSFSICIPYLSPVHVAQSLCHRSVTSYAVEGTGSTGRVGRSEGVSPSGARCSRTSPTTGMRLRRVTFASGARNAWQSHRGWHPRDESQWVASQLAWLVTI